MPIYIILPDILEEGMAIQSDILAWRIPWTEEPGGLQVHGVAKSWPQLKQLSVQTPFSHLLSLCRRVIGFLKNLKAESGTVVLTYSNLIAFLSALEQALCALVRIPNTALPSSIPCQPLACCPSLWVSLFWTFHICGIMQYVAFCV